MAVGHDLCCVSNVSHPYDFFVAVEGAPFPDVPSLQGAASCARISASKAARLWTFAGVGVRSGEGFVECVEGKGIVEGGV